MSEQVEPVVRERTHGTFSRQVFMGENLDTDALSADDTAGALRLSIPVHPSAKARRILGVLSRLDPVTDGR